MAGEPGGRPVRGGTGSRREPPAPRWPFLSPVLPRQLVEDENVRGVITMNEEYETRFLCNSAKVTTDWERGMGQGQGQGRPPAPSAPWLGLGQPWGIGWGRGSRR